jgi:hypothetical protein
MRWRRGWSRRRGGAHAFVSAQALGAGHDMPDAQQPGDGAGGAHRGGVVFYVHPVAFFNLKTGGVETWLVRLFSSQMIPRSGKDACGNGGRNGVEKCLGMRRAGRLDSWWDPRASKRAGRAKQWSSVPCLGRTDP